MRFVEVFADRRLTDGCAFCGAPPTTRDHVPARVFLDRPFPPQLPLVQACQACNEGSSLDEEYVACLIECARSGSTDPARVGRERIARILAEKPRLRERLGERPYFWRRIGLDTAPGQLTAHGVEEDRVARVLIKLALGHAAYELAETFESEPDHFVAAPIGLLSDGELLAFEDERNVYSWPEVTLPEIGSRAFDRIFALDGGWQEVQSDRYRYMVVRGSREAAVRIVLSEYLACEVAWQDPGPYEG